MKPDNTVPQMFLQARLRPLRLGRIRLGLGNNLVWLDLHQKSGRIILVLQCLLFQAICHADGEKAKILRPLTP